MQTAGKNTLLARKMFKGRPQRCSVLTFKMCKCTECAPGTVGSVLDVITLGRLVDLGVELLLGPGVAVLTRVAHLAVDGVAPLVRRLYRGAGGGPVLVLPGAPPPVLVVVILRAGVALSTQTGRLLARFGFVVCQDVGRVQPLGVVVEEAALLI